MLLYWVLGDLRVGPDGEPLPLPTGRALPILVALLLNPNRLLSVRELLTAAWGRTDVDPGQLHKQVSYVRALLRQLGHESRLINHRALGYELRVGPPDLDSLQFVALVKRAEEYRSARRFDDELDALWAALRLWRGHHPLADVDNHCWTQEATDLEDRRRRAATRLFRLELGRHRYESVLADLAALTTYHPTDRRLLELRMLALYRCGLGADAYKAFEHYVDALEQETGAAPEPDVRKLAYAVSNGDEATIDAVEAAVADDPSARDATVMDVPRQLPAAPAHFVGREDRVDELRWLLTPPTGPRRIGPMVVVISGLGGSGKTTLMVYVAHLMAGHYPDGQLHVDLRGATAAVPDTEVLGGLLRALGLSRVPETRADRLAAYRTITATRPVLLLLDDALDEAQIRDLIPANPASAVLITARRPLPDLDGAHPIALESGLPPATAAELFRYFASVDAGTEIAGVERVVELCARLPLAVRLAASLSVEEHLTPTELADQLAARGLAALTYGPRNVSLTIGASVDRLTDDAKRLFLGLALTELPEFTLWTAAALLDGTGADPRAALSRLATYYLIEPVGSGHRYRFHDLTRAYARGRAIDEDPDPSRRRALVARAYGALLTLARRGHRSLVGGDFEVVHSSDPDWAAPAGILSAVDADAWAWFERERTSIRAAVDHSAELGLASLAWDLAVSTHEFYASGRYFDDWYATATAALEACRRAGDRRGEAVTLVSLGQPMLVASRRTGSVSGPAALQRAIDILIDCDDQHGRAIAERTLANALRRRGHLARPLALFEQALDRYTAAEDALGRWQTLRFIGQTHLDRGDAQLALDTFALARSAADGLNGSQPVGQTTYWVGRAYLKAGELAAAEEAFRSVLEMFAADRGPGRAYALHGLGEVALRSGDLAAATDHLARAAEIAQEADDTTVDGRVHLTLADLHRVRGNPEAQIAALEHAVECFAGGDAVYFELTALEALSQAEAARGHADQANAVWARVESLYVAMDLPAADRTHRPPPTMGH